MVGTVGLVTAVAASAAPNRFALVFTVAATYFAASLVDGVVRSGAARSRVATAPGPGSR
jgi:hypothetical protein